MSFPDFVDTSMTLEHLSCFCFFSAVFDGFLDCTKSNQAVEKGFGSFLSSGSVGWKWYSANSETYSRASVGVSNDCHINNKDVLHEKSMRL